MVEGGTRLPSTTEIDKEFLEQITEKKGAWFICPYCEKGVYETKGHLVNHLKWKHADILKRLGAA